MRLTLGRLSLVVALSLSMAASAFAYDDWDTWPVPPVPYCTYSATANYFVGYGSFESIWHWLKWGGGYGWERRPGFCGNPSGCSVYELFDTTAGYIYMFEIGGAGDVYITNTNCTW